MINLNEAKTLTEKITDATRMLRTATMAGDARGIRMWAARLDRLDAERFAGVGTN
jgi:hypothetical protein